MARVSIYVTDELKARMDGAGDAINWSDVARVAFQGALATQQQRRTPNMETAIARLRASKEQSQGWNKLDGYNAGREWGASTASFEELRRLAGVSLDNGDEYAFTTLRRCLDPEQERTDDEIVEECFGERRTPPTDEYVAGFIEGAQEFFAEVEDKI